MTIEALIKMELHEQIEMSPQGRWGRDYGRSGAITRVPGGWIYSINGNGTFVPEPKEPRND